MRKHPQPSDYQGAVQNPQHVFADPVLKTCKVRKNPMGLPLVSSGGFALSFFLDAPGGQQYVVRCFKADSPDRRARYDAISRFLDANPAPFFLDVDYLEQGILVNGGWYPIVKMPFVKGMTLHRYVEGEITGGRSLQGLSGKFRQVVEALEKAGAAHGDLQHGNIMVQGGELVLIDYDGMYVPALKGRPGPESGQPSYQHPDRSDQFNPDLDRFSTLVIDLALRALAVRPELWARYSNGDNMLFRQGDFADPGGSKLLRELEALPGFQQPVAAFRDVCGGPLEAVPRLADFAAGKAQAAPAVHTGWLPAAPKKRPAVYNAHDREELLKRLGEQVTIVGCLADYHQGLTKYRGQPYLFLNFGDYRASALTLVLWSDALALFQQQGRAPADYVGKWVQVTGMLTAYNPAGGRGVQPQIEIEVPTQIELVQGGQAAAAQMLALPAPSVPPAPAPAVPSAPAVPPALPPRSIDAQLNRLYGAQPGASATPPPATPPTFNSLGIHVVAMGMGFGRIPFGQTASRQLQIRNYGRVPALLEIVDQPPFLTVRPSSQSCPAGASVMFDVELNTAAIPAGMLQRKMTPAGPEPESLLQDASLLVRCSGAEHLVAINCTLVHDGSSAPAHASPAPAPAPPASPPPGPRERRLMRAAWITAGLALAIAVLAAYSGGAIGLTSQVAGGTFREAAVVQPVSAAATASPAAVPGVDSAGQLAGVAAVCPADLPVTLDRPKGFLMTDEAVFTWRTDGELPATCTFQVKLWRQNQPRMTAPAEGLAREPDGRYQLAVLLPAVLPTKYESEGLFYWTVELAPADASGQGIAVAAEPVMFYWIPEAN